MAVVIKVGETEAVSVDIGEKVYIKGDPGFSPIVEIEEIPRGHRITIISESGSQSFDVMDGDGKGITSTVLNPDYTLTIFYTDGTSWTSSSIRGETGPAGPAGAAGDPGTTFTPSVSAEGVISWTNDGGKTNPQPVNIKGPQGPQGPQGPAVPLSDATPLMDDTATPGTGTSAARADHVHPADTNKQDIITASGILKGNGSAVSAAIKGTDYGALAFTVTLTAAGWSSNAQTVSNANFLASGYGYIVSPASGSFAAYGSAQIYADDVTTAGRMTFHCTDAPSTALTVNIARVVSA